MPPRLTFEDDAAELAYRRKKDDERREQSKLGMRRLRAERRLTQSVNGTSVPVNATPASLEAVNRTPPRTPPVSKPSVSEIERVLAPFAKRGYVHNPRFWRLAAEQYPLVNLELEAIKLADWLKDNPRRKCSKTFLDNWLQGAEQRRLRREREAAAAPAASPKGVVVNGTWHPPAAFQRNPGPPPDEAVPLSEPLQTFTREELARLREEHARVPFKEKLAAKAALATNGVHK